MFLQLSGMSVHLEFCLESQNPLLLKGGNVATYDSGHLNWKGNLFSRRLYLGILNIAPMLDHLQNCVLTHYCACGQFKFIHKAVMSLHSDFTLHHMLC